MTALLPLLLACADGGRGPRPVLDGDGFFGAPFPSDLRTVDGHPDMTGFPGRDEYELVELYSSDIETLDGFGTNAPVWIPFDGALDTAALPDPATSATLDSPILLVDVDPDSPRRGQLVPWTWAWTEDETSFQPAHLLTVQPLWGAPLHPARTYAVVVRTDIARPARGFSEVWQAEHPDAAHYDGLEEVLFQLGVELEDVAAATVFTTQDPLDTVRRAVDHLQVQLSTPPLDQALTWVWDGGQYDAYEGQVWIPTWQHGEPPFTSEGGGFAFDQAGVPVLAGWQQVLFRISIPEDQDMPPGGWPVVLFGHGTGGDQADFANEGMPLEPAAVLARSGLAGISISLPLHGDRGTGADPSLLSFNYFNPTAARGNFQQAVLDAVFLSLVLTRQESRFTLVEEGEADREAVFDPTRVAYLGHSHGGIVGAMAAPWLGETLRGVVLSGAGGGLALSVVYRKQGGLDVQALIASTFDLDADETVTPDHPLIGMVQTLGEAVDPINYAPYWSARQPWWHTSPVPVLMTTGLLDEHTPSITSQVLAGAGGLPILDPVSQSQDINELSGLVGQAVPCADNVTAWDGSVVSGGLAEFPEDDHFPIYNNGDAASLYATFLQTAVTDDAPLIDFELD